MLPPVAEHVLQLYVPVLVPGFDGGLAGAVAVKAWENWDRVINIKALNSMIEVINLFFLISVVSLYP